MKQILLCASVCLMAISIASAQTKKKPAATKLSTPAKPIMKNLLDSFSYAAGLNVAGNMKEQGITELNSELMKRAIDDVLKNKPKLLTPEQSNMSLQEQLQAFAKKKSAAEKEKGVAYLAENKKRKEVTSLANGLQYEVMKAGDSNGSKPGVNDTVVVHYAGTLIDGTGFDNSYKRGEPATFSLGGVIRGWTLILQEMRKGDKWKVYIPSELGYGDHGNGSIPPGATLIFEIELLDIKPFAQK